MSEPIKKITLLLVSLLVTAVVFIAVYEVVENIRYRQWREDFGGTAWLGTVTVPSENPELMWEYRPHATHKRIHTNNHGFRGEDVELQKPPGTLRIAFVGDSVTLGYGIEEASIFVTAFDETLGRSVRQELQTLNFGIDGYGAPQIAELLRSRALGFQPDHVIYTLCLNDFDFTTSAGDKVLYFRKPRSFFLVKLEHLSRKVRGLDFHTHKFLKNRERAYRYIEAMHRESKMAGSSFELALLPIFPQSVNSFAYYPHEDIHQDLEVFAKERGIPFTDLLDVFRRLGGPPRAYANDVWHPNADGHRVIGEHFARDFLKRHPSLRAPDPSVLPEEDAAQKP